MKILMITPNFPPEMNPEAIVNGKFAKALVQFGHELTVVTRQLSGFSRKDESSCWEGGGKVIRLANPFSVLGQRASNLLARICMGMDSVSWFALVAKKSCSNQLENSKYDLLLTRSGPVDSLFLGKYLKSKYRVKWAATINDPLPNCLYPPPYSSGKPESVRDMYQFRNVRSLLIHSDVLIFPSSRLSEYMEFKMGIGLGNRTVVLPHIGWRYEGRVVHASNEESKERIDILHIGSVGSARVASDVLEVFFANAQKYPGRFVLTFVGLVDVALQHYVTSNGFSPTIKFEGQLCYFDSLKRIQKADALFLKEARMDAGIFLPSKFCDYAVSGKPVLLYSPSEGTISDLVGGNDFPGFLGQDKKEFDRKLGKFMADMIEGKCLERYVLPQSSMFQADSIAEKFTSEIQKD